MPGLFQSVLLGLPAIISAFSITMRSSLSRATGARTRKKSASFIEYCRALAVAWSMIRRVVW